MLRALTRLSIFENLKVEKNAIVLMQSLKILKNRSSLDIEHALMPRTICQTP